MLNLLKYTPCTLIIIIIICCPCPCPLISLSLHFLLSSKSNRLMIITPTLSLLLQRSTRLAWTVALPTLWCCCGAQQHHSAVARCCCPFEFSRVARFWFVQFHFQSLYAACYPMPHSPRSTRTDQQQWPQPHRHSTLLFSTSSLPVLFLSPLQLSIACVHIHL